MHHVPPIDPLRPLLDAAIEGNDAAMASLVRHTQDQVWRLCGALGSPDEQEDLVQETYLRAIRSASTFRGESLVSVWLLSIARNVCASHVRGRQRDRRLIERIGPGSPSRVDFPDHSTHSLLAGLDDDRREAFVLTQILGMTYQEAADLTGCPIGTVRSRVARARADLLVANRDVEAI